ncbi:MAG: hypothetical protein HRT41_02230 [Campylobacteraceae bacterium]|nr:hypothetical protein [Campylobacteraceae bacterium]
MDKKYITKSELSKIVGTSAPYITKLEAKDVFIDCIEDNKLLRFETIEAYLNNIDFTRDSQREANANKRDTQKQYITKKDLALAFGVSAPRISALDKNGIFKHCYDGKKLYRLAALKSYVDKLTKTKAPEEEIENTNNESFESQTVEDIRKFYQGLITLAKTPLQKASISKEEDIKIEKFLKNQELEKNLVDINVVKIEAFELARKIRDSFSSLPDRLSAQLLNQNKTKIHELLTIEINYILKALADDE